MKIKGFSLFIVFAVISGPALAESQTATLKIQNMTCAVCPITVKMALEHVPGVHQVKVDFASKTATVQFDDSISTAEILTKATKDAGYPATIKGDEK
jgi:periplasmic mercuric ion binding protein